MMNDNLPMCVVVVAMEKQIIGLFGDKRAPLSLRIVMDG